MATADPSDLIDTIDSYDGQQQRVSTDNNKEASLNYSEINIESKTDLKTPLIVSSTEGIMDTEANINER
ncbi:hypothetical protein MAR_002319 [Mya arenaria]|uniref:Uncharacterized protein n=1 Tax=Mya arenaria TaxID=6604 RepID=A0ABY7FIA1_MYAAR|nr:hypothetical protein MAR_002319 [Mya arenaria]